MPHHPPVTNDARRSATRVATLVAVPVALLAGFVAFQVLKPATSEPATLKPQATGPVTMPARPLDERQATVCRALLARMPEAVRDRQRRQVTSGPEQNAAFGDPAITVVCGGETPSFAPTETVYPLSEVCWVADSAGIKWTTVDREVPVVVTVPAGYDSPGQWVTAFSGPISATIPAAHVPTGCKPA
jgi:Protein of unknown function (DUF3515)